MGVKTNEIYVWEKRGGVPGASPTDTATAVGVGIAGSRTSGVKSESESAVVAVVRNSFHLDHTPNITPIQELLEVFFSLNTTRVISC